MESRSLILIDGSNFYFKLKDLKLHNLLQFKFHEFAKFIARKSSTVGMRYYIGRVRQDGSKHAEKLLSSQQRLLEKLKINYSNLRG